MKSSRCILTTFLLLIASSSRLFSQAPANDDCSGAILFNTVPFGTSCSSSVMGSTVGATRSAPNLSCGNSENDDDVWYRFVANSQSIILRFGIAIETGTGDPATVGFALYANACPTTTSSILCNNLGSAGFGYHIVDGLTIGSTYYLRFWSTLSSTMSFQFCVQDVPAAPVNDECSGALPVIVQPIGTICNSGTVVSTVGATRSIPDPSCGSNFNNDDVWYSFVAISPGIRINFSGATQGTIPSGNANVGYALYSGSCPATTATFLCNNNIGGGSGSALIGGLVAGQTYFLRLFSFNVNNYMNLNFCIAAVDLPVNDECITAAPLTVTNGFCTMPVSGNSINATTSAGFGPPSCATLSSSQDVWHRLTVPASGNVIIQTFTTDNNIFELVMEAYSGTCGALSLITCSDNVPTNPTPLGAITDFHPRIVLTGRTPGEQIFLRVLGKGTINFGPYAICAWDSTARPAVASAGACIAANPVTINAANGNRYRWVPIFNAGGDIIAEIFPNGSELGQVNSSLFVNNSGSVRSFNGKFYLDRNISITPSTTGSAVVRIYFKAGELAALLSADPTITGINDLQIVKVQSACQPALNEAGALLMQQTNNSYGTDHYLQFMLSSFSGFYINKLQPALPVSISSYNTSCSNGEVMINWRTVTEIDNAYFTVERSRNGIDFYLLATVPAAGNSNAEKKYNVRDAQSFAGKTYYRLRQTDLNGRTRYFAVLSADCNKDYAPSVYPNPFTDHIVISTGSNYRNAMLELWSTSGVMIKKSKLNSTTGGDTMIMLPGLASGVYYLRLLADDGRQTVLKITKEQ
jgi:hypothetical protein